jgi:hypothetical protein
MHQRASFERLVTFFGGLTYTLKGHLIHAVDTCPWFKSIHLLHVNLLPVPGAKITWPPLFGPPQGTHCRYPWNVSAFVALPSYSRIWISLSNRICVRACVRAYILLIACCHEFPRLECLHLSHMGIFVSEQSMMWNNAIWCVNIPAGLLCEPDNQADVMLICDPNFHVCRLNGFQYCWLSVNKPIRSYLKLISICSTPRALN